MSLTKTKVDELKELARENRKKVLQLIHKAQTSHIGSNLSCADLMTALYEIANITKELKETRDRIIWSKGWSAALAYTLLWRKGILTDEQLETFGQEGGLLGLVERPTPGIEASGGAMGHGLPLGLGMALGAKRSGAKWKTYVLMSDGEMDCGSTWESALLASHHKLDNLIVILDYNKIQAMGNTNEVLNLEPLAKKWDAFGWKTVVIDGHDMEDINFVLRSSYFKGVTQPKIIIAHTEKGHGVSFMRNKLEWHYKNVSDEDYKLALAEL